MLLQKAESKILNGCIIDNLEEFMTEEILWHQLKNVHRLQVSKIKLPRERDTQKFKGYAFVGFSDIQEAQLAKKKLNFTTFYSKQIRVALIGDLDQNANIVVKNVGKNVSDEEFDKFFEKWGVVMSSRLAKLPNGDIDDHGYVQFQSAEDAERFMNDNQTQQIKLGGNVISATIFGRNEIQDKKNIYLKEYKRQYNEIGEEEIKEEVTKITQEIRLKAEQYGKVASIFIRFSPDYKAPFSFVCFYEQDDAAKALEAFKGDTEFPFSYISWAKTKAELQYDREHQADRKFLFIKNLNETTTEQQLKDALSKRCVVKSAIVKKPKSEYYKTKFATVIIDQDDKLLELKQYSKDEGSDFNLLFAKDKRAYISMLHPKKYHKNYISNQYAMQQQNQLQQTQPFLFSPMMNMMNMNMPPGVAMQGMQGNMQLQYQYFNMNPMMQNFPPQMDMMQIQNFGNYQRGQRGPRPVPGNQFQGPQRMNQFNRQQMPMQQQNYRRNMAQQQQFQQQPRQYQGPQKMINPGQQPKPIQMMGNIPPQGLTQQGVQQQQQNNNSLEWIKSHLENFKALDESEKRRILGGLVYPRVIEILGPGDAQQLASKVTGMLIDLDNLQVEEIVEIMSDIAQFADKVKEAKQVILEEQDDDEEEENN